MAQHVDQEQVKRKRGAWFVVFIVALVVLVGALAALGVIAYSYLQGQQKYDGIAEVASIDASDLESEYEVVTVDWDALLEANPDTVAWVYIPHTAVNYPIVQGDDNDYYLTHDFDGDAGWLANYGAVFLDYRDKPDFSYPGNFIYGHHMNDGSMFADISGFDKQERFDECRTVYLLTPNGNYRLRSFSLVHCQADDPLVQVTFEGAEEMEEYLADKVERSVVEVNDVPELSSMKRIFAFATCDDYSSGRFVLYTYVESTSVTDLAGTVGIETDDEGETGFDDELTVTE